MAIKNQLNELDYLPAINVHLLERRISCVTVPRIVDAIHATCVEDRKITVAHYNVHSFNLSMQLPWFYQFIQSAEIAHCDGMGILKAHQFMGYNLSLKYRASYTLLLPKLLENVNQNGLSMFLLGSKPKHLETALTNLRQQYPNIIVNGHHGYFDKEDPSQNQEIINKINQTKPNILLVGMGMPIQEKWIWQHRSRLNVNVFMPCGAVIDRLAGLVPDCPEFISNLGGEWLYRLSREPKRLAARYLLGNPAFFFQLALAKFYAQPLRVEKMGYMLNGQKHSLDEPVSLLSPLPQGMN
ncbi:WecB/TagA/CpsF family glycosyltransferase [Moorena sp. SIO3I6]|uniref:WecB/TagA/CpsF family glycosyltransferase n=1 Tax=Moorena sp. SIO3I6 TaxID=2607831 RepID=UPI0025CFCE8F|nr:WecB/TagA/CpsF family glycosyltransferase [Moorena sp. SIO3I6]